MFVCEGNCGRKMSFGEREKEDESKREREDFFKKICVALQVDFDFLNYCKFIFLFSTSFSQFAGSSSAIGLSHSFRMNVLPLRNEKN